MAENQKERPSADRKLTFTLLYELFCLILILFWSYFGILLVFFSLFFWSYFGLLFSILLVFFWSYFNILLVLFWSAFQFYFGILLVFLWSYLRFLFCPFSVFWFYFCTTWSYFGINFVFLSFKKKETLLRLRPGSKDH